eukprot:m.234413 g.234413  ORF g.234413 m.234413 type:complete len:448 (+) comp10884_c0_seq29:291-1634(+)
MRHSRLGCLPPAFQMRNSPCRKAAAASLQSFCAAPCLAQLTGCTLSLPISQHHLPGMASNTNYQYPEMAPNIFGEEENEFSNDGGSAAALIGASRDETVQTLLPLLHGNEYAADVLADILHSDHTVVALPSDELKPVTADFNPAKTGIWIDPLDATSSFIKGGPGKSPGVPFVVDGLPSVTILIGVFSMETGLPVAGVVNQPFHRCLGSTSTRKQQESNKLARCSSLMLEGVFEVWLGEAHWGVTPRANGGSGVWGAILSETIDESALEQEKPASASDNLALPESPASASNGSVTRSRARSLSTSKTRKIVVHSKHESLKIIRRLKNFSETCPTSGAGYKCLLVIRGLADAFVLTLSTTFKWDICGPQAILEAQGGELLHSETHEPLKYLLPDNSKASPDKKWANEVLRPASCVLRTLSCCPLCRLHDFQNCRMVSLRLGTLVSKTR